MRLIAFDPGRETSFAIFDTVTPFRIDLGTVDMIGQGRLLRPCPIHIGTLCQGIDQAVVEEVGARPEQGVTAMFTFGLVLGSLLGAITAARVPLVMVTPQEWKKSARLSGLGRDESKDAARAAAKELWPEHAAILKVKKNHGLAEAGLMSRWYFLAGPGRGLGLGAAEQEAGSAAA